MCVILASYESSEPYLRFTCKRIPLFVMVLLVGTLNFVIRQNILHETEIYVCRSAAMLCNYQKRAATPHTCDVCMSTVKVRTTQRRIEGGGERLGGFNPSPRNSEVLSKSNRIAISVPIPTS